MKFFLRVMMSLIRVVFACQNMAVAKIGVKSAQEVQDDPALQESVSPGTANRVNYLAFRVNFVYRAAGAKAFDNLTNDSVLYSGDQYKIIFTALEECYIYIFQLDSAGMVFQLFPMQSFGGVTVNNFNPIDPGKTYYIPSESKSFALDAQTGTERMYFLASRTRNVALEEQYRQASMKQETQGALQGQQPGKKEQLFFDTTLQRAIVEVVPEVEDTHSTTWQEDGHTFSVLQQRLENMCDGCMYILTFTHR